MQLCIILVELLTIGCVLTNVVIAIRQGGINSMKITMFTDKNQVIELIENLKATQAGQQKKVSELLEEIKNLKEDLRFSRDREAYYLGKCQGMYEIFKLLYGRK